MMKYDYDQYLYVNYNRPLIFLAILGIILIVSGISTVKDIIKLKDTHQSVIYLLPKWCIFAVINVFLICLFFGLLIHGGFALKSESETDAVSSVGVIESISNLNVYSGQRYVLEDKTTFGTMIQIDGVKYKVMDTATFAEGNTVAFSYLPKSFFILSLEHYGNEKSGSLD